MGLDLLAAAPPPRCATLVPALALCAACTFGSPASALDTTALGIPGTWVLRETRAGNLCEAQATFAVDDVGGQEGRVTVRSPCIDPGNGVWKVEYDGEQRQTFGWALDYEKSYVFYSATQVTQMPTPSA